MDIFTGLLQIALVLLVVLFLNTNKTYQRQKTKIRNMQRGAPDQKQATHPKIIEYQEELLEIIGLRGRAIIIGGGLCFVVLFGIWLTTASGVHWIWNWL